MFFSLDCRICSIPEEHSCQFSNQNSVFNIAVSQSINMHNNKKKVFLNEKNNDHQRSRCGVNTYIRTCICVCSSNRFVGDFQLTTLTFKRTCHVDPQSSGILLKTLNSFPLKLAPKLSFISAFWHKPVWVLQSAQPTQPESLTHIRSRTFWKLPILLFPVESVFYPFSCHIQKSNAFIMIIRCQQRALHCAVYNTTGRVFSRDKVCCSLANSGQ